MTTSLPSLDPERTALLVMDYQNGIVASLPGTELLLGRVAQLIATARRLGIHVGYVRVGFTDDERAAIPATSAMAAAAQRRDDSMHPDSPHTAVHEDLAPHPDDIVVRKVRVGAFSTTDLDEQLRGRGVDTLLLAGISTSGVVLSTVRDAADRDYRIVVVADACADRDPQVHDVLVQTIFPRQTDVVASADVGSLFA